MTNEEPRVTRERLEALASIPYDRRIVEQIRSAEQASTDDASQKPSVPPMAILRLALAQLEEHRKACIDGHLAAVEANDSDDHQIWRMRWSSSVVKLDRCIGTLNDAIKEVACLEEARTPTS